VRKPLPFNHPDPVVRSLAGAIGHARCVLSEGHQSVESQRIAQTNIAKYTARLAGLGVAL
jgi:hypothetical protein